MLETTEAPITNTVKRKEVIDSLLNYCKKNNVDFILGDFNTTIINEREHYTSTLEAGYFLMLSSSGSLDKNNLTKTNNRGFVSKLLPNAKTTVVADGLSKPYDRILVNEDSIKKLNNYGIFKSVLSGDFREYIEDFSDHLPIFITFRKG